MSTAVLELLKKNEATKKTVDQFKSNMNEKMNEQFKKVMQEIVDAGNNVKSNTSLSPSRSTNPSRQGYQG